MFTFTFIVTGDVIKFSETRVVVFAESYPEAIKKVKSIRIPELRAYDDISEMLKMESVEEWEDFEYSDEEDLEL